jgi:hypothetical protein
MPALPFRCPHCGAHQFVAEGLGYRESEDFSSIGIPSAVLKDGRGTCFPASRFDIGHKVGVCVCCRCQMPSIYAHVVMKHIDRENKNEQTIADTYFEGRIYPPADTPEVHVSVPSHLQGDFKEGWAIRELSPRASALLARRCAQGAVRDFCGIAKDTLAQELRELERRHDADALGDLAPYVARELLEAIRAVRRVGDLGAQMAKGVDTIVPATREEAGALLLLVQMLFAEWYQARSDREAHLANVLEVATGKHAAR